MLGHVGWFRGHPNICKDTYPNDSAARRTMPWVPQRTPVRRCSPHPEIRHRIQHLPLPRALHCPHMKTPPSEIRKVGSGDISRHPRLYNGKPVIDKTVQPEKERNVSLLRVGLNKYVENKYIDLQNPSILPLLPTTHVH